VLHSDILCKEAIYLHLLLKIIISLQTQNIFNFNMDIFENNDNYGLFIKETAHKNHLFEDSFILLSFCLRSMALRVSKMIRTSH